MFFIIALQFNNGHTKGCTMYITNDAKIWYLHELFEYYKEKYCLHCELLSTEWERGDKAGEDFYGILIHGVDGLPEKNFEQFHIEAAERKLVSDYFEENSWLFYDPDYEAEFNAWLADRHAAATGRENG